jgi:LPS-assembly lipoprotein
MSSTRLSVIVDLTSARPELENYGINAAYDLVELKTGRTVFSDVTFSRVSYDIPGQQQRFAQARGLRDAENRAAEVIAQAIRTRLASYFVAGT